MADSTEIRGVIPGAGGLKIFYRHFPAVPERARLLIVHGMGEHSGRYHHVAERLQVQGVSSWALDLRGHGQSEGKKGHVETFSQYHADVGRLLQFSLRERPEGVKLFLLGHSMGGLVALGFAQNNPEFLSGVIASSPALAPAVVIPGGKKLAGHVMSVFMPGLTMGNDFDAKVLSHDETVVKGYQADPFVHNRVSARMFTELMSNMEKTRNGAERMAVPILMQVAGLDKLVDPNASREFYERLTVEDRTLHMYDECFHEIYNESEEYRPCVLSDLESWLLARF